MWRQMRFCAIEGNEQRLDGGAMFGNAPKELWKRWATPDEYNCIPLATRSLLITNDDGTRILIDAGIGTFFPEKLRQRYGIQGKTNALVKNLAKEGVSTEEIDIIILSHMHFDHVGGLLSDYNEEEKPQLIFPNASFFVSEEQWERARQPHLRDHASFIKELPSLLTESKELTLVQKEGPLPNIPSITVTFSHGHTPGMMVLTINSPQQTVIFCSDLIPGTPWVHLPITMGYDRFPEKIVEEKELLLQSAVENNALLCFTHDPHTAFAHVTKNEKGRYCINTQRVYFR
ncbi:MBL fold metallo-hydrolase [Simkania negevensis]|uniref:MBL fold metallo-hydrolase n=1 Tax=Simkania negevensis TaxID=83561 RepID=A0ABS3AR00_9BACT|nr:MBL fold metallo-hydrolase [Simkania negevensis]